jgi:hypothetical protein
MVTTMTEEINAVTKALQQQHLPLMAGRSIIDLLKNQVDTEKQDPNKKLCNCPLLFTKSGPNSSLSPNPKFDSGVVKIQAGKSDELTPAEARACKCLLKKRSIAPTGEPTASPENMKDRIKRMLGDSKDEGYTDKYHDCSFIYASSAQVERLWSIAKHVLMGRMRMTPQLFEALLYLKENRRFWDDAMVKKAIDEARSERIAKRISEEEQEDDFLREHSQ